MENYGWSATSSLAHHTSAGEPVWKSMQMIIDHHMFSSANPITAKVQTITQLTFFRANVFR
jgi:hypothetical protein